MTKKDEKVRQWRVEVLEDGKTKELYVELPTELLNQMGWATGDTLEWMDNKDGISWTIKKKVDKKP